jgi:hypothetical protein
MATAVNFPASLMAEASESWNIAASTFSPGQTGIGSFPLGRLDGGGLWVMTASLIVPQDDALLGAFRALRMLAKGGVRAMIVPRNEAAYGVAPWPVINGVVVTGYGSVAHSDNALFDDGSGYAQPAIVVQTVGEAALRDVSLTMHFIAGSPLRGGEVFSIEHPTANWRMYEVTTVTIDDNGDSVVTFEPPLREAVDDATAVEFDLPRCLMRCTTPDALGLEITTDPFARPNLGFVEFPW